MQGEKMEDQWSASLRKGDDGALAYFFRLHNKSLCYFATRLIQEPLEAEDIVSDCFLKLWENRENFKTSVNIKSFLYISCRNACLDYLKHLKVKSNAQQTYFNHLKEGEETILFTIMETEFLEILSREIELLPPKCKEIFKLIYFEGKKTDEIALQLDLSVQTVRNQKTRAVELLKNALLKKGMSAALSLAFLLFIDINQK
ncbi:MAG TPA: RNA polymerase sigma-70 factor [Pedobacter sp.]